MRFAQAINLIFANVFINDHQMSNTNNNSYAREKHYSRRAFQSIGQPFAQRNRKPEKDDEYGQAFSGYLKAKLQRN